MPKYGYKLKVTVSILCVGALAISGLLYWPIQRSASEVKHDLHLERLRKAFSGLKHPPGSSRLQFISTLGVLDGNGNHCDFFTGELRSYAGSRQRIEDFYKRVTIQNPFMPDGKQSVEVVFLNEGKIPQDSSLPTHYMLAANWSVPQEGSKNLYIVHVLDASYNAEDDVRCH